METVKRVIAGLVLAALCVASASAQVHVRGYFRKDGTYVAPYVRSSPNHTKADNYSTQGNYNPYTGQAGTSSPYPQAQPAPSFYVAPTPAYHYSSAPRKITSVWRCVDAYGNRSYLAYPRAGCDEIQIAAAPQSPAPVQYFSGYPCTINCSGHEAGYKWADKRGIDDPDDCGGNSQSFIEGCEAYAQEHQEQMIEDGDCDDEDEDNLCD